MSNSTFLKHKVAALSRLPFSLLKPKRYHSRKSLITRFLLNLFVATAVVVALHSASEVFLLKEIKDKVLDWLMYFQSDFEPITQTGRKMQRMALFEIDDKTYREWGSPVIMPRDKLKSLIEQADKGGANVVVVDMSLTWLSDGCFHEVGKNAVCSPVKLDTDVALGSYLQKLNEEFHSRERYDTPIVLLSRTYRKPLDENGAIKTEAFLEKPFSFLEGYIRDEKNVFWTNTFFVADEGGKRRSWQPVSLVCEDNHLTVVPSMPLLAAMAQLYSCKDSTRNAAYMIRQFKRRLNAWAQTLPCDTSQGISLAQICQKIDCPNLTVTVPNKAGVCDKVHEMDLAKGRETERIVYRFAPPDNPSTNQRHLIEKYSALDVLKKGANVEKQIVFIGVTHQDNGKRHPIPIRSNEVDDVYSVANAVDTLLRFGQFQPPPLAYKISVSIVLVIILTLIFSYYKLITALVLSTALVGTVLLVFSGQALHHGIGIDVAMGMMAIQLLACSRRFIALVAKATTTNLSC